MMPPHCSMERFSATFWSASPHCRTSRSTVFHPVDDDGSAIARLCPPGSSIQPEQGTGYSEILPAALRSMLQTAPIACLVGADSPGLPSRIVKQAFEAVEAGNANIAIGPSSDGGYYLLAVDGDYPGLFLGIDWGTDRVFDQVSARATDLGLDIVTLPEWYDVDDFAGLSRLVDDLARDASLGAPSTRSALRRLRRTGHDLPAAPTPWHVHYHRTIHATPWRTFVSDEVETHRGEVIDYTYVQTESAVWVVPVTTEGRIVLIRQYRHPIREFIVEVPAGSGDEPPDEIARRELAEETGGVARDLIHVADYYPASAHLTHEGHVFVALDVEFGRPDLESTELLSVFTVPFPVALDMARRGEIGDSQSALAILAAEPTIRATLNDRRANGYPE
ncbi:MAG: DUF2064 domain-containing protein [Thermomicrobiales bacterium]